VAIPFVGNLDPSDAAKQTIHHTETPSKIREGKQSVVASSYIVFIVLKRQRVSKMKGYKVRKVTDTQWRVRDLLRVAAFCLKKYTTRHG
jgi:hypothetical protein